MEINKGFMGRIIELAQDALYNKEGSFTSDDESLGEELHEISDRGNTASYVHDVNTPLNDPQYKVTVHKE